MCSPCKRSQVYDVYLARRNDRPVPVRVCAYKAKGEGKDGVFHKTPSDHQPAKDIRLRLEKSSSEGSRRVLPAAKGKDGHLGSHSRRPVMTRDNALSKTGKYQPFRRLKHPAAAQIAGLETTPAAGRLNFGTETSSPSKSPTANETTDSSLPTSSPSR